MDKPGTGAVYVCDSDELKEADIGVRFEVRTAAASTPLPAFAVRSQGQVVAYLNQCRHVAMELDWQARHFFDQEGRYLMCATHGALYEPQTGLCVLGPCRGQSLIPVPVIEKEHKIWWLSDIPL